MQIEIAGKTVKVFVFPESSTAAGDGTSASAGKPPASFPRYSFQVRCHAAISVCLNGSQLCRAVSHSREADSSTSSGATCDTAEVCDPVVVQEYAVVKGSIVVQACCSSAFGCKIGL